MYYQLLSQSNYFQSGMALLLTFVFAMWPASEAARCPTKPNVISKLNYKFTLYPSHVLYILLAAGAFTVLLMCQQ